MPDYEVKKRETVVRETPVVHETIDERESVVQAQRQVVEDSGAGGRALVSRIAALIWVVFGVLDALIALRVVLQLIAANPGSGFADFVYKFTDIFLAPFSGLVASPVVGNGIFEISSLIAIVVYALLAWVIVRIFRLIFTPARTSRSVTTYQRDL